MRLRARCAYAQHDCREVGPALAPLGELLVRCHHPVAEPEAEPRVSGPAARPGGRDERLVLAVAGLTSRHRTPQGPRVVVADVELTIAAGETLALVGESGSGKSTLLRTLAGIHPDADGELASTASPGPLPARRREIARRRAAMQIVFQNSDLALNPRHTLGDAIGRSLKLFRPDVTAGDRRGEAAALLEMVRLPASFIDRFPASCQAASASASPSPAPSPAGPRCCCATR